MALKITENIIIDDIDEVISRMQELIGPETFDINSITDAYLTAADWSVNATVTTDGTSSSDYGDNVSINYSYESSTGCSYTSLKVLLLNNVGEVLGYGIGFVNDVPVGENVTSTMYAIAAPHSLDSLADMAMFSCPTLE